MTQALVATGAGLPLEVREVELRPLTPVDVRVRIAGVGVCHSDLSMVNGTLAPSYPLVLGHEAAGVVAEVGDRVAGIAVGDHVVLNWAVPCRACWFCTHGEPWLCAAIEGMTGTPGGTLADGTPFEACLGLGAMAEEVVCPATAVVPIPDDVPLEEAALLGCAILTGVGAALNAAHVRPGDSVLIVAVDTSPAKEALARAAGATDFVVADRSAPASALGKQLRAMTDGRGVDAALECVGSAGTIRQAWTSVRRGGRCVVVGLGPKDQQVTFNPLELFHFSRTLVSSIYGNSDPERDMPVLVDHLREGRLDLAAMVTDRVDLSGVPAAFERMARGEGGRTLVVFGQG